MQKAITIAVDAMGGDNAPGEIIKGAVLAVREKKEIKVVLVGKEDVIVKGLSEYDYDKERIEIVHAEDVITNNEAPVMAIRRKKNSSIVTALNMVKAGDADAFVSAGSTLCAPSVSVVPEISSFRAARATPSLLGSVCTSRTRYISLALFLR
jgi:glycerol-3-phosphate acyltransferase PlsX